MKSLPGRSGCKKCVRYNLDEPNIMRILSAVLLVFGIGVSISPAIDAQETETSRVVQGGGIAVAGWTGKIDASEERQGQVLNNAKLTGDANLLRVTTGPAVTYWNPANKATGNYTVK